MRLLPAVGVLSVIAGTAAAHTDDPPPGFQVAFVGDTPLSANGDYPLFTMLRSSGVQMIVHSGDLSYSWDQERIFTTLDTVMGKPFPFVAAFGNHDLNRCTFGCGYSVGWVQDYAFSLRYQATQAGVACTGEAGTFEECYYNGIVVVNIAYKLGFNGFKPKVYANFINEAFGKYPNAYWRICNFHKPEHGYDQDRDPAVMEACRANGAIVANGHDHSYIRTKLMASYRSWQVSTFRNWDYQMVDDVEDADSIPIDLAPGQSIQWVSGLGGHRPEVPFWTANWDYVAKVWPAEPEDERRGKGGAVICTFNPHYDGLRPSEAECVFRDIEGTDLDVFTLRSRQYDAGGVGEVLEAVKKERQEETAGFSCFRFLWD